MNPANVKTPPSFPLQHWWLPLIVAVITAPLWLGLNEPSVFYFLNQRLVVLPDIIWSLFCLLGTGWCVFALTAPLLLKAPRIFLSWLCAAPFAGVLTRMGKMWAENSRPLDVLPPDTIHVIGEPLYIAAMPSGHTLTAFAAVTAIYFALAPQRRRRFLWLFLLAFGVALARVAVGAHWPADVSVGAALGIASGLLGSHIANKLKPGVLQPQSWLMRGVALFGLYSAYVLVTDKMGFSQNMPYQYLLAAFLGANLMHFAVETIRRRRSSHSGI